MQYQTPNIRIPLCIKASTITFSEFFWIILNKTEQQAGTMKTEFKTCLQFDQFASGQSFRPNEIPLTNRRPTE